MYDYISHHSYIRIENEGFCHTHLHLGVLVVKRKKGPRKSKNDIFRRLIRFERQKEQERGNAAASKNLVCETLNHTPT
jgi:hypothetical protein